MAIIFEKKFDFGVWQTHDRHPDFPFHKVDQVHSAEVIDLGQISKPSEDYQADGMVDKSKSKTMGIRTADCLPILIAGENGFGFLHAGWRGVQKEIIKNPLILALKPKSFYVGPHINCQSFAVTSEFLEHFPKSPNFHHCKTGENGLYFDLFAELKGQVELTFPNCSIENSGICTFKDQSFHSFRRDKTECRNWHVFKPKY